MQMKMFLEQANNHLPNLSRNLFILFNHWDQVVDEDEESDSDDDCDDAIKRQEPKALREQHLQRVDEFFVQGLQSNGVLDRTFFVSGKEVCKAQENEKKGKQPSAGRSVVYICLYIDRYIDNVYTAFPNTSSKTSVHYDKLYISTV